MELEKGKIDNYQFVILIIGFLLGSAIIFSPGGQAKHDAWIAIILGMGEGIIFALIYGYLSKRFQGKTLIQIHEIVYGPYIGKLISLMFLWYLLHLDSMVVENFMDFLSITTMPRTPDAILSILLMAVCAYAVGKGIEVIARCSQILVPLIIGLFFFVLALLIKNINLKNFFPILEVPFKNLLVAAHGAASFPFAETVAFMMIFPFLKSNREVPAVVIKGLLIGGFLLVLQAIRIYGLLGATAGLYAYQNFQADRLVNVGTLINRLEILAVIGSVAMGFVKIVVLLYGIVLGGAQMLGLRSYRPLIIPVAILIIILAQINFRNVNENIMFAQQIYPIYALPFELGIPLFTFIIAFIRGLPKKQWK
jgi:spore germination protein (amino acid permease)